MEFASYDVSKLVRLLRNSVYVQIFHATAGFVVNTESEGVVACESSIF